MVLLLRNSKAAWGGERRSTAWRRRTAPFPEAVIQGLDTGLTQLGEAATSMQSSPLMQSSAPGAEYF